MKKRLKKIAAIISAVAIAFSIGLPAIAATADAWGNAWYTPTEGKAGFYNDNVYGQSMKWPTSALNNFSSTHFWELEFRIYKNGVAAKSTDIYDVNAGANLYTNLPNAYYEYSTYDAEDVSIGCSNCSNLVTTLSYFGKLSVTPKSGANTTEYSALIESEYGTWLGMDGLPLRYAQWKYIPIGNYDRW